VANVLLRNLLILVVIKIHEDVMTVQTFMPKVKTVMMPLNTMAKKSFHNAACTPSPAIALDW
jgi:hypothetical protein